MDARAAISPADAGCVLHRFAAWCVQAYGFGWSWYRFDLSWIATTFIGARQLKSDSVEDWSKPVFDAFLAGAWMLHWTEDTLYWVAKPDLRREETANGRRFHNDAGPAVRSDVENLYYWHGVMVPAFLVTRPDWITLKHVSTEDNAEVRRVMIERYGLTRYLLDSGAKKLAEDEFGELYRSELPGDEPIVMVKVINSTPELDGSRKPYFLRVHPDLRPLLKPGLGMGDPQKLSPLNAVASTFGLTGKEYLARLVAQS